MKIGLLGYGRMGREVEAVALERGHTIAARYTSHHQVPDDISLSGELAGVDCLVDFSVPASAPRHIRLFGSLPVPLVVGTTGWHDQIPALTELVRHHDGALFYASNFSIGAQIFLSAVTAAATLIDRFPEYDIAIHETHHRLKKDAPSGTALTIARGILDSVKRKTSILTSLDGHQAEPHELVISSARVGSVTGTHSILFDSSVDSIQIVHTAHNRRGFALGAVVAAEWLVGRKGVFTMEDLLFTK